MPWDRGYYYRAVRRGGRPTRVYIGGGPLGELAAWQDAIEREARAAAADERRAERAREGAIDRAIDADYGRLRTWAAAWLLAGGWYQHRREWRRMGKKLMQLPVGDGADRIKPGTDAAAALEALVKRTNGPRPSRADLDALRAFLAAQDGGGLAITAISGMSILGEVIDASTASEASRLVLRADANRLARTLGRDSAPPFERPLIDHTVTCWVRLQLAERDMTAATSRQHSMNEGAYRDKRLSEAQRRYLRALHLLAKLRHMGPAQVNIANQQVVMNGRSE